MSIQPDPRHATLASYVADGSHWSPPRPAMRATATAIPFGEFIEPGDLRWRRVLARARHDVYHLPEYAIAAAKEEGGTPTAFFAENDDTALLIPLIIRDLPPSLSAPLDWRDATTPYGYACPIVAGRVDAESVSPFIASFRDAGRAAGLVTAFFRLHPLLTLPDEIFTPFGALEKSGVTVYIDLQRSSAELWSDTRRDHRTGVRKLQSAGYVATVDDWSRYDEFIQAYRQTMERVGASDFYFFSDEYFADLRAALEGRLHLCTVSSPTGEFAAGGLFCVTDGMVQYHLSSTADAHVGVAPSKLMLDHMRGWAQERANTVLHLGGGLGGREDSLFQFKAGFSPLRADFRTFRMVLDASRYEMLIDQWKALSPDDQTTSDYFPRYRCGIPSRASRPALIGGDSVR